MIGDNILAGPNWKGELVGKEIDAFGLREIIEDRIPLALHEKYKYQYNELTKST